MAYFSCYGAQSVDIAAPGQSIYSTVSRGAVLTGSTPLWMDNVENNDSNWTPTSTWAITDTKAYSGTHSWTDSPDGNSPSGISYLTYSKDINLTAHRGEHIGVGAHISYSLGKYASFAIEMSADGGQTWSAFEPLISTGRYASSPSGWSSFAVEIPKQFKTSHFRMRFKFYSGYHDHDGIYLDNIAIGSVTRPNRYNYLNGTSMATPFVTGSLALIATVFPDENVTQRIDRLLSAVTPLESLKGKILTGGQLNVEKALRQDLVIKSARFHLDKNYGIAPGDTLEIKGTGFGEVQGTVVFEEDGNSSQEVTPLHGAVIM